MSHIQLSFNVQEKDDRIKLNLTKSYNKQGLFSQLPYLANLEDLMFQNEIQNIINNQEDFQIYLLATSDLNDSIQESLDLVVSNGLLNDGTAVWLELNKITTLLM